MSLKAFAVLAILCAPASRGTIMSLEGTVEAVQMDPGGTNATIAYYSPVSRQIEYLDKWYLGVKVRLGQTISLFPNCGGFNGPYRHG